MPDIQFIDLVRTSYGVYEAPCWMVVAGDMVETENGSTHKVLSVLTVGFPSREYAFIKEMAGGKLGKLNAVYRKEDFHVHE